MGRVKRLAAKSLRMVVEIDLVPLGKSDVYENCDGEVLFPARIAVDGKPIEAEPSQESWFLVKTEDWYLHMSWGARLRQPRKRR